VTSAGKSARRAATKARPCPVCEGDHSCSVGEDGLIFCRRRSGPQPCFVYLKQAKGDDQWAQYRREGDPHLNGHAEALPRKVIAATYDYKDEAGCLKFQSVRYVPKGFKQRRPDGRGDWIWNLQGVHRLLYRLPELLTANPAALVFVAEGEKDVDNLRGLGLVASCNPEGAGKWKSHFNEAFRGRRVVVLPDNDDKGRRHAQDVANNLRGVAAAVAVLRLPGLPEKGDVSDWLAGGGTKEQLLDLAEAALAAPVDTPQAAAQPASGFCWSPVGAAAFARADYRPHWLVRRVLVADQPAILGGPRKSLKTNLLLDLAVSLASGTRFLGAFEVPCRKRVAVLSGESGEFTLQETARRVCAARDLDLEDLDGFLTLQFRLPQLAKPADLAELGRGLRGDGVEVGLVDPLYLSLLAGQGPGGARAENLYDMGPLLLGVARAGLDAGTTPVFAHHTRRAASGSHEPLDLDDLAYAGIAEFARQWLLLSRRAKYEPGSGLHKLWLNVGGSTGHGGLWGVDVSEGNLADDFTGRTWTVTVQTFAEERQSAEEAMKQARRRKDQEQDDEDDEALLRALDRLGPGEEGCGLNQVQSAARLTDPRMRRSVQRLTAGRLVEEIPFVAAVGNGGRRTVKGLRRCR
jgi:hypothetical protein